MTDRVIGATSEPSSAARSSVLLFGSQALVALINLPVTVVLARTLKPEYLGQYQVLNRASLVLIGGLVLGLPYAIAWAAAEYHDRRSRALMIRWIFVSSALAAVVCVPGAALVAAHGWLGPNKLAVLFFGLYIPLNIFSANQVNFFRGQLRILEIFTSRIVQASLWLSGCIVLAVFGRLSVASAAATLLIAQAIAVLVVLPGMFRKTRNESYDSLQGSAEELDSKKLTVFAARVFPGLAIREWSVHADQLVVGLLLTAKEVGLYAVGASIALSLGLFTAPLINTIQPIIQKAPTSRRGELASKFVAAAVLLIGLPCAVLAIAAPQLLPMIYGSEFSASIAVLEILFVAAIANGVTAVCQGILIGIGMPGRNSVVVVIGFSISLALWFGLTPIAGIAGAAAGSAVSAIVTAAFCIRLVAKALEIDYLQFVWQAFSAIPATVRTLYVTSWSLVRGNMTRARAGI